MNWLQRIKTIPLALKTSYERCKPSIANLKILYKDYKEGNLGSSLEDPSSLEDIIQVGIDGVSKATSNYLERDQDMSSSIRILKELSEDLPSFESHEEIDLKTAEVCLEMQIRKGNQALLLAERRQKHSRFLAYMCAGTLCLIAFSIVVLVGAASSPLDTANALSTVTAVLATLVVTLSTIVGLYLRGNAAAGEGTGTLIDKATISPTSKKEPTFSPVALPEGNKPKASVSSKSKTVKVTREAQASKIEPTEPNIDELP